MPVDEQTLTAPVVEGNGNEIPSTEIQPPAQAPAESQTTTTGEVDPGSKEPQAVETPRRKPSDFYRERQRIRNMEDTIALQNKKYEELAALIKQKEPGAPPSEQLDHSLINVDPDKYLSMREKKLIDKITSLEQQVSGWQTNQEVSKKNQKSLEALEKLFPKTSPDSNETIEQRVNKDPERAERIREFLVSSGLDKLSEVNPDLAVKYALLEIGEAKKPNPMVLKKTLMGGASTGNPSAGANRANSEQDLKSENKKINDQLEAQPALRFDKAFMERRRQVLDNIERLVTKK